jgi:hypothetical protein
MRIAECGMRNEKNLLRVLNAPRPARVEHDADGRLVSVSLRVGETWGVPKTVEGLGESWRIDDEWWRQPIIRRYVEVVLEGGARVVLFEDIITGEWFAQMPT